MSRSWASPPFKQDNEHYDIILSVSIILPFLFHVRGNLIFFSFYLSNNIDILIYYRHLTYNVAHQSKSHFNYFDDCFINLQSFGAFKFLIFYFALQCSFVFRLRYDIVCHLNTAANGAEEHYSLVNNSGTYHRKHYILTLENNFNPDHMN